MKFTHNQILAFIFGLGASITVRIVGIFAISDLIAIAFLPFIIGKRQMFADKRFRTVIILLLLWMFSAILSDIYNNTSTINSLKGFFTLVTFFACLVFAYWLLIKDYNLMVSFLWGYAISFLLSAGFGLDAFYIEMIQTKRVSNISQLGHYSKIIIWIISSFIGGAFSITYFKKYPYSVALSLFLLSFLALIEGSRSTFLMIFITSCTLFYILHRTKDIPQDETLWQERLRGKIPRLILILFILFISSKSIYEVAVLKGYMGKDELGKYEMQKNTKLGLLSGRSEIVSAFLAIKDAPLLGHGSFAIDTKGYGFKATRLIGANKITLDWSRSETGKHYIPTHSHIWQAWVYNGFLGAVFWLYILFGVLLVFISTKLFAYPNYMAYILSSLATFIWNILFSPFSQRPLLAASIVFFIVLMASKDQTITD